VTVPKPRPFGSGQGPIAGLALLFFAVYTGASCARWANFEYRTFDLAYYVQALWQLIHGRFEVSVQGVPLLGNHVEPIVFLIAPLFLLVRHPMVLVVVQNALLASMGPVAFAIARRLGLDRTAALLLGAALLLTPAAGYIALHEFHPEALAAPFLLLLIHARLRGSLHAHWGWMIALLACKENMALLVAAYCVGHVIAERKRPFAELRAWYLWPLALSLLWFVACTRVITPALNSGNIDYLALYDRLGASAGDILLKAVTEPSRILAALSQSLMYGNLVWALLLPFLALPLLRPRWLLIASPILLQHLLSWRSSEWTIFFHYAAPLLPLFWIALAESVAALSGRASVPIAVRRAAPFLVLGACLTAQIILGPARGIILTAENWFMREEDRARKAAFIRQIPPDASVLAPLPYLSHLALREKLFSLHYVLKGLKTLSRSTYEPPPPTDVILVDYDDTATFDPDAGYYHPAMKTVDGRVIPSSEQLFHEFLKSRSWSTNSVNELTLLQQTAPAPDLPAISDDPSGVEASATLLSCTKSGDVLSGPGLEITTKLNLRHPRDAFPWLFLKLTPRDQGKSIILSRGLCSPQSAAGMVEETWRITPSRRIPAGDYTVEALFVDNSKRAWAETSGGNDSQAFLFFPPVSLGELRVPGRESN
jgi:uncharacterized membrane protein